MSHWQRNPGRTRQRLTEELADLFAALTFVIDYNKLDPHAVDERFKSSFDLFVKWHQEQGGKS